MASKILANILVAGGTVLLRAATQAWKQAIVNGQRQGMTPETLKKTASLSRQMPLEEAYEILGTDSKAGIEEVMKRYQRLMEQNEKHGSFYLQSKVFRARERIEQEARGQHSEGEQQQGPS